MMTARIILVLLVLGAMPSEALSRAPQGRKLDKRPTLEETLTWIGARVPQSSAEIEQSNPSNGVKITTLFTYANFAWNHCVISDDQNLLASRSAPGYPVESVKKTSRLSLDLAKLSPKVEVTRLDLPQAANGSGWVGDAFSVRVHSTTGENAATLTTEAGGTMSSPTATLLNSSDEATAKRIASALGHAIEACGGKLEAF